MPEYRSGISHPPNSMNRAPADRCQSYKGVRDAIEKATRVRMKAFLPAKLIPTRLVARGHHGYFPRAPLRAQRLVLRPRDPRHGLFPHPIPRADAEPGLAEVDPSCGRRVRGMGSIPRIPRRARGRFLLHRHDSEREGVRAAHLDHVEGTVREEPPADRGAHVRPSALRVRATFPREEARVPDQKLITRRLSKGRSGRDVPRPRGRGSGIGRRARFGPGRGPPTPRPYARTTSAPFRKTPGRASGPSGARVDTRRPGGPPPATLGCRVRSARKSRAALGGIPNLPRRLREPRFVLREERRPSSAPGRRNPTERSGRGCEPRVGPFAGFPTRNPWRRPRGGPGPPEGSLRGLRGTPRPTRTARHRRIRSCP